MKKGTYRIPVGTDVLVLRRTDPPDAWRAHTTRRPLAFDKYIRFDDRSGSIPGRLVFAFKGWLLAVPCGLFIERPSGVKYGALAIGWPLFPPPGVLREPVA
jgi:hypothetical protein